MSGWRRIVPLLLALLLFGGFAAEFRTELIDDAYISLTYARNLDRGHGLVWNPEEAVEGYTDFFWVILLALAGATPGAAWGIGVLAGAILVAGLAVLPSPLRAPGTGWLPLVVAAHLSFPFWAAKGLETSLFALLLTAGIFLHAGGRGPRDALLSLWALSLAALTRPEGILFVAVAVADHFLRRDPPLRRGVALLLPLLLLAPHLAFRLSYYGYPLPNTYYAKVGAGVEQCLRGLDYLRGFLWHPGAILLIGAVAFPRRTRAPERRIWMFLLAGLAGIVYVGGDAFGAHRFLVPLLPTLALAAIHGFARLAPPATRAWLPAGLALLLAAGFHLGSRSPVRVEEAAVVRFTSVMVEVGKLLRSQTPEWFTIALNPAGAIPYFSERRAIDMLGLNDAHIAHRATPDLGRKRAGHEKGDGLYVLDRAPELILIGNVWVDEKTKITEINPSRRSEVQIMKNPRVFEEYEVVLYYLDAKRSLKALMRREGTDLEKSGWRPENYEVIEKERWQ